MTVYFIPTVNNAPQIADITSAPYVRLEYEDIIASADATLPTNFVFSNTVAAQTGISFAIAIAHDGNEDFVWWKDITGDVILGTNTVSSGPSGKFIGNYYTYISPVPLSTNTASTSNNNLVSTSNTAANSNIANANYTDASWRPTSGTSLKFQVSCARYAINGNTNLTAYLNAANTLVPANAAITVPVGTVVQNTATNTTTYNVPVVAYEFIVYDRRYSIFGNVLTGERVWQWKPYIGGFNPLTVSVIQGTTVITCSSFSWNTYYAAGQDVEYIVVVSENHDGPGVHRSVVRKVTRIIGTNTIVIDEPVPWSNGACFFYKTAVGRCQKITPTSAFGKNEDIIIINESNANSSVRFTNNCIEAMSVVNPGGGYSNSDYIIISGYEYVANAVVGGSNCYANIMTNSTGNVVAVKVSNPGCGFVNVAAMTTLVVNSTGGATNGTGLTLSETIGSTMIAEFNWNGQRGFFRNCRLVNMEINSVQSSEFVINPLGTYYNMSHRLSYYCAPNPACFGGVAYYRDSVEILNDFYLIKPFFFLFPIFARRRCHMSWSHEVLIQTIIANTSTIAANSSMVVVNSVSNSDFSCVSVADGSLTFSKYIINNDYTGENTDYGNALAKGISTQINLANSNFAEDIQVNITAYRPANTDIKVFAKIQNSNDPDSFDSKDWTMLQVTAGNGLFSSQTNANDYVEISFGFGNTPNTAFRLAGSGTATLNSANIVGIASTWGSNATANLHAGDLVRVSQPLFPNNQMICSVANVVSDTVIILDQPVSNNGMVGSGLAIEKIAYPRQAFTNILNNGIVRYYNSVGAFYDTYDTIQFKVVMLADNPQLVPNVDDLRACFVSA